MVARTRTITGPGAVCTLDEVLGGITYKRTIATQSLASHRCDDHYTVPPNKSVDNPLTIVHDWLECSHWPVEKHPTQRFRNVKGTFVPTALRALYTAHWNTATVPLSPVSIAGGLARANPSRPVVDLPVFLFELGDLPRLIQVAGQSIVTRRKGPARFNPEVLKAFRDRPLEAVSSANLNYHFGWAPLIGDVLKLLEFSDHVDRKVALLRRLYSGKGLRRRVKYQEQTYSYPEVYQPQMETEYGTLNGYKAQSGKRNAWQTSVWKPTSLPPVDEAGYRARAIRATLGLDLTMSTIWEAIPFSWLVDWYSNVGDILMSQRNTIPATVSRINTMVKDEHEIVWRTASSSYNPWGGARRRQVVLRRTPGGATMDTDMPFLDVRKLSILGSLSVLQASAWQRRA